MKRERWTKEYHWTHYPVSEIEICRLNEREADLTEWILYSLTSWLTNHQWSSRILRKSTTLEENKPAQSAYRVRTVNCIEVAYDKSIANAKQWGWVNGRSDRAFSVESFIRLFIINNIINWQIDWLIDWLTDWLTLPRFFIFTRISQRKSIDNVGSKERLSKNQ